ncbi:MAG TPA: nuclear transport factor 2 family protein [Polyangiaceae bacterium]|nr:nuclear transport factor 2 family protein [Polyangiaceae bacterium]
MNAEQLLRAHLDLLTTDVGRWVDLFADDALVEFPYAGSLGVTGRFEGRDAVAAYFTRALADFEGLTFSDVRVHPGADPGLAVAEVHGAARIKSTGRRYEQDYVMVVRARGGRIVHYREYWNPLPAAAAFGLEVRP